MRAMRTDGIGVVDRQLTKEYCSIFSYNEVALLFDIKEDLLLLWILIVICQT